MNAIYVLLIISIVSGFITSMIAFVVHKSQWYKKKVKSPIKVLNFFISNIYQFNGTFLNVVSVSVAIATSIIVGNIIYILFFCDSLVFDLSGAIVVFLSVTFLRTLLLLAFYLFFYEEQMLKD